MDGLYNNIIVPWLPPWCMAATCHFARLWFRIADWIAFFCCIATAWKIQWENKINKGESEKNDAYAQTEQVNERGDTKADSKTNSLSYWRWYRCVLAWLWQSFRATIINFVNLKWLTQVLLFFLSNFLALALDLVFVTLSRRSLSLFFHRHFVFYFGKREKRHCTQRRRVKNLQYQVQQVQQLIVLLRCCFFLHLIRFCFDYISAWLSHVKRIKWKQNHKH